MPTEVEDQYSISEKAELVLVVIGRFCGVQSADLIQLTPDVMIAHTGENSVIFGPPYVSFAFLFIS